MERDKETDEETSNKRTRKDERGENETVSAKRWCVGSVSVEAFDIFRQKEDSESCDGFSWEGSLEAFGRLSDCDLETWTGLCAVLDVIVVLVSPSSVVTECFGDVSLELDLVASRRRWLEHKGEMVALQERWQNDWQDINMKE